MVVKTEPIKAFVHNDGCLTFAFVDHCESKGLDVRLWNTRDLASRAPSTQISTMFIVPPPGPWNCPFGPGQQPPLVRRPLRAGLRRRLGRRRVVDETLPRGRRRPLGTTTGGASFPGQHMDTTAATRERWGSSSAMAMPSAPGGAGRINFQTPVNDSLKTDCGLRDWQGFLSFLQLR